MEKFKGDWFESVRIKNKFYVPFRKQGFKGKYWIYGIGRTPFEAERNLKLKLKPSPLPPLA